jgi:hypothetical protein
MPEAFLLWRLLATRRLRLRHLPSPQPLPPRQLLSRKLQRLLLPRNPVLLPCKNLRRPKLEQNLIAS